MCNGKCNCAVKQTGEESVISLMRSFKKQAEEELTKPNLTNYVKGILRGEILILQILLDHVVDGKFVQ